MEVFAAIGLAGNILTFVEFGLKLVSSTNEVIQSGSGMTEEFQDASTINEHFKHLIRRVRLPPSPGGPSSYDDRQLSHLVTECLDISDELEMIIKKSQSKRPFSRTEGFISALRSLRNRGKLKALEERLGKYKDAVLAHISLVMSDELSEMNQLIKQSERATRSESTHTRHELKVVKEDILKAIQLNSEQLGSRNRSPTSSDQIYLLKQIESKISRMLESAQSIKAEDRILKKLWFADLRARQSQIEEAHEKTFKWLLRPAEKLEPREDSFEKASEAEFRCEKRQEFTEWLSNGYGIFHITGKAGSGKSTLMKLIASDSDVRAKLEYWATSRYKKLVFARCFFWASGSLLQRSLEGLYRGMIWEILSSNPRLIPEAFPLDWTQFLNHPTESGSSTEFPFQLQELRDAFGRIVSNATSLQDFAICIFIDGLDEYDGDYWELAKSLKSWASTPGVKICVSSRPVHQIAKAFDLSASLQFKLDELTKADISRYVLSKLDNDERFHGAQDQKEYLELVLSVTERAAGVFLWVRLAIKELLNGLGNHDTLAQLRQKLNSVPDELTQLLRSIVNSISRTDRPKAFRTFAILILYSRWHLSPLVAVGHSRFLGQIWTHTLLDDIMDDQDYRMAVLSGQVGPVIPPQERDAKIKNASARLITRCRNLVELNSIPGSETIDPSTGLTFIHRSVCDFFDNDLRGEIDLAVGELKQSKGLMQLVLAQIKHSDAQLDEDISQFVYQFFLVHKPIFLSDKEELNNCMIGDFHISSACSPTITPEFNALRTMLSVIMKKASFIEFHGHREYAKFSTITWSKRTVTCDEELRVELIKVATSFRCNELLDAAVTVADIIVQPGSRFSQESLRVANAVDHNALSWHPVERFELITPKLLKAGIHVNSITADPGLVNEVRFIRHEWRNPPYEQPYIPQPAWTVWTEFLFIVSRSIQFVPACEKQEMANLVKLYLTHHADPSVLFIGYTLPGSIDDRGLYLPGAGLGGTPAMNYLDFGIEGIYFANLETMFRIWDLKIQVPGNTVKRWSLWNYTPFHQKSSEIPSVYNPLPLHDLSTRFFAPLKVLHARELSQLDIEDLEGQWEEILFRALYKHLAERRSSSGWAIPFLL